MNNATTNCFPYKRFTHLKSQVCLKILGPKFTKKTFASKNFNEKYRAFEKDFIRKVTTAPGQGANRQTVNRHPLHSP